MGLTDKKAWQQLRKHAEETGRQHLSELFEQDGARFENFSLKQDNLLFDFSKQRVERKTIDMLCDLARECDLGACIDKLFTG